MIKRELSNTILKTMSQFPVVTLTGPRQSGKTTLLRQLFPEKPYISMEDPDQILRFNDDPKGFLDQYPNGAFFDEFQKVPALPSYLQRRIDDKKQNGLYILSGSQQLEIMASVSQSLAGRTAMLELLPLSLSELNSGGYEVDDNTAIAQGFYPRQYDQQLDSDLMLKSYVKTYLERDIHMLINIKNFVQFQRFLTICASRVGQIVVASQIANEVGVSVTTIQSWLSILQASYIIYLLPPFYTNISKRLIKSPKLYFYDVGLASFLLGIQTPQQVSRDPLRGGLFENMIIMDILKTILHKGQYPRIYFYRDKHQKEVDLLIQQGTEYTAIEIKSASTFHPNFISTLNYVDAVLPEKINKKYLLYAGNDAFEHQGANVRNWREFKNS